MREKKGCFSPIEKPWYRFATKSGLQEISYKLCPGNSFDHEMSYLIDCHDHYEKTGEFPDKSSFVDVPSKIVEIFNLIYTLKTEHQADLMEEQKRKNGKRN